MMGNDGKARVGVPASALPQVAPDTSPLTVTPDVAPDALAVALAERDAARAEADRALRRLAAADAALDGVRVMLTRAQAERLARLRRKLRAG